MSSRNQQKARTSKSDVLASVCRNQYETRTRSPASTNASLVFAGTLPYLRDFICASRMDGNSEFATEAPPVTGKAKCKKAALSVCGKEKTHRSVCLLWSGLRGSNSLPPPWQGGALPDELSPQMVPRAGIEPATRGFSVHCSTN